MQGYDWEALAAEWTSRNPQPVWRAHSDAVNRALLSRWLPPAPVGAILKTDLFDEAFGEGLVGLLGARCASVHAIDVSDLVATRAAERLPALQAVCADVRALPYADEAFDAIVSISTLDHFHDEADIAVSLAELCRTLKPGGRLILTMDNRLNPIVGLRNVLPFPWLRAVGLVPYFVGHTYGPRGVRRAVERAGLRVADMAATLHCPRVLAVPAAALLDRRARPAARRRFERALLGCERLASWRTRYLTGHFVAVLAVKP